MEDLFGSVRRSLVFRPNPDNPDNNNNPPVQVLPLAGAFVEKINSCIRKSRVFAKTSSPPPPKTMVHTIRWRKGELIGCGAFGRVYMGMNLDSGELLAVKQVLIAANSATKDKAQTHIKELEEEVKLLKNLSHPNIVRYLGTVREEETLNILLEFVSGGSISSLLGKFGSFPEAVIRTYTKQLLLGLEYLHTNGIMHRDIKGANILVDNKGCIKLADFGASKQVAELATISGAKSMKGTPYWMAPEVILQTGHNFSADIWSVGCTVIEMATGKPPWSQQYQEVAALFYIGTTKSHPPIPEHLSVDAQDFLLKCLQKEPNLRPAAVELLKHPFVTGEHEESTSAPQASVRENCDTPLSSRVADVKSFEVPECTDSLDVCNLGTMDFSTVYPEKSPESRHLWGTSTSNDDMCQIGKDDFIAGDAMIDSDLGLDNVNTNCDTMCELSADWTCKFDESNKLEQTGMSTVIDPSSLSEDDEELIESKITAFLDDKALELKKLQSPLYEEFLNSMNVCSPSCVENRRDETPPNYLKLPPKSRSPSRGPVRSPSTATDAVNIGSPGSNSRRMSNVSNAGDNTPQENSSPQLSDPTQQELNPPSMRSSEKERKWKEELDRELETKRERMRQGGMGGNTSSPKDKSLTRHREKTRFASPGK